MIEPVSFALAMALSMQAAETEVEAAAVASEPVEETQASTQKVSAKVADEDDEIICRRTAILGSRFKKRICGTKKQWQTLETRAQDNTREFQRRGKGLEPNDSNKSFGG